jgi:hypothetical protein
MTTSRERALNARNALKRDIADLTDSVSKSISVFLHSCQPMLFVDCLGTRACFVGSKQGHPKSE